MQPETYYNAGERPPGDDNYTGASGKDRSSSNTRRHAQQPTGAPCYHPPPTWSSAPTHVAPPKIKLPPFRAKDPLSWFTLVESTFNRHDVVDSRLRFDLILPALPEEVIGQIHGVLRAVEHLDRPYVDLKARLLKLFTPKLADNCLKLIHSPELGDRRPIQRMEAMLALLPPDAEDNILFKTLDVTKLPKEVRGHVFSNGMNLDSRELSELADDLWCGLNERHSGAKFHHMAAAVPDDSEELAEAVATLNVQPKHPSTRRLLPRAARARESSATSTRSTETRHGSVLTPAPARCRVTSRPSGRGSSNRPHGQ